MKLDHLSGYLQKLTQLQNASNERSLSFPLGVDLSGNDYLGLSTHPKLLNAAQQAIDMGLPMGSGGSRLLRGHHPVHEETEAYISKWKNSESALLFTSGYHANTGVIETILPKNALVFADKMIHASMIDGIYHAGFSPERFRHQDLNDLERRLKSHEQDARPKWVMVESVYSMDGDITKFSELIPLCEKYGAELIVDEAHGTGVYGKEGIGVLSINGYENYPMVSIHTCGKAMGTFGAFITCSETIKRYLINFCRPFIYTTALSPFQVFLIQSSLDLIRKMDIERAYLLELTTWFRTELANQTEFKVSTDGSMIIPVIIGSSEHAVAVATKCQEAGFDIRPIRPPTVPEGSARLRISLHSNVKKEELERLIGVLKSRSADH